MGEKKRWRKKAIPYDTMIIVGHRARAGKIQRPLGVVFVFMGLFMYFSALGYPPNIMRYLSGIGLGILGLIILAMKVPLNTVMIDSHGVIIKKGSKTDRWIRWMDVRMIQKGRDGRGYSTIAIIGMYHTYVVSEGPDLTKYQIEKLFRAIVEKTQRYDHLLIDELGKMVKAGRRIV